MHLRIALSGAHFHDGVRQIHSLRGQVARSRKPRTAVLVLRCTLVLSARCTELPSTPMHATTAEARRQMRNIHREALRSRLYTDVLRTWHPRELPSRSSQRKHQCRSRPSCSGIVSVSYTWTQKTGVTATFPNAHASFIRAPDVHLYGCKHIASV